MANDKKPLTGQPNDDYLSGYKRGLLDGLDLTNDECGDDSACQAPPQAEQHPLSSAQDDLAGRDDLAGQDRLGDDDQLNGDDK